jgi:hypothetical protein
MDELLASGIKLAYPTEFNFIFENGDGTEASKVQGNRVNSPSIDVCLARAKYQINDSIFVTDISAEESYAFFWREI